MKVIKETESQIDLLFEDHEIGMNLGPFEFLLPDIMERVQAAASKNGLDLNEYRDIAKYMLVVDDCCIMRIQRNVREGSPQYRMLGEKFCSDALRYIDQILSGTLKTYKYESKSVKGCYVIIKVKSVDELKPVVQMIDLRHKSSLYKKDGTYVFVINKSAIKDNELVIREFVDIEQCNSVKLTLLEEYAQCISKNKAAKIIQEFY